MTTASVSPAAPRGRRGAELAMLAFAVALTVLAYVNVGLAHGHRVPADTAGYGAGLAALFLIGHLAVRRLAPYADPLLLPIAVLLNGIGLVVIRRLDLANVDRARRLGHLPPSGDARLQLAWTAVGMVLFLAVLLVIRDHRWLQRFTYTSAAVGLALLLLPALLPRGHSEVNGAHIWVRFSGFSFQPAEVAKLALEVFFAGYLVAKRDLLALAGRRFLGVDLPRARDLGPLLVAWAASLAVLVRENDLGTSLLFFGVFVVMLYVATERRSWLLIGLLLFVVGAFAADQAFSHVAERVDIWLHPFRPSYIEHQSYQLVQGLFGLGTGGIFGTGLGLGRPDFVPFAKTDFIAAALGEELGLVGLMAVLALYGLFTARGLRTALAVRDSFGKLLAVGLSFGFALQVFVQVGGVVRLIPLTGLTLPFLSYGGSSLVANWMLVALLLRISNAARRPTPASRTVRPEPGLVTEAPTQVVRR